MKHQADRDTYLGQIHFSVLPKTVEEEGKKEEEEEDTSSRKKDDIHTSTKFTSRSFSQDCRGRRKSGRKKEQETPT